MSVAEMPKKPIPNWEQVRDEWVARVTALVDLVEGWAKELGWATRRVPKRIEDDEVGTHQVPALQMQEGTTRLLLEPLGRTGIGIEGVVDLYEMPAFDDVARLVYRDGGWYVGHPPGEATEVPLTRDSLRTVVEELVRNGA